MTISQWLRRLLGRPEKNAAADWQELSPEGEGSAEQQNETEPPVPEEPRESPAAEAEAPAEPAAENGAAAETAAAARPTKPMLNALAGRTEPLEAEAFLAEFIALGWEAIEKDVTAFALGRKVCLRPYLKRILAAYPEESASLFEARADDLEPEQRLLFLEICGGGEGNSLAEEIRGLLPDLDDDEIAAAFAALAAFPSAEGNAVLTAYLSHEDWRLKMKAAAALEKAGAAEAIPAIRAAAEDCGGEIGGGLNAIAARMEGKKK